MAQFYVAERVQCTREITTSFNVSVFLYVPFLLTSDATDDVDKFGI